MFKKKQITAGELANLRKPKSVSRQAVHDNKNLPYELDGKRRLYDLNNLIVRKWLNGESIIPVKKKSPAKKSKIVVKKNSSKKSAKKKTVKAKVKTVVNKISKKDYNYLKKNLPAGEHDLLDKILSDLPGFEKGLASAAKKLKSKSKKKSKPIPKLDPFDIPDHLKKLTDSGQITFAQAMKLSKTDLERIKIYEQIKEIKTKAEQRREGLIEKKLVRTVFSKFYEIDMNQYLSMKDKLIPDIAATLGATDEKLILKAAKILDDELWKILGNIKRVKNKFLKSVDEKEIK